MTSLLVCQPHMNWEFQVSGISVKTAKRVVTVTGDSCANKQTEDSHDSVHSCLHGKGSSLGVKVKFPYSCS